MPSAWTQCLLFVSLQFSVYCVDFLCFLLFPFLVVALTAVLWSTPRNRNALSCNKQTFATRHQHPLVALMMRGVAVHTTLHADPSMALIASRGITAAVVAQCAVAEGFLLWLAFWREISLWLFDVTHCTAAKNALIRVYVHWTPP